MKEGGMDKQTIEVILQFLGRVSLKGTEVQAFNEVLKALTAEREKLMAVEPKKEDKK